MFSLEDEAVDVVLEIDDTIISRDDGVDAIINSLNELFKKGSTITNHQALEPFETFKRHSDMFIQAFLNKFYKRLFKAKSFGTIMSDDILADRMLKAASVSNCNEELIKETIFDLQYDLIKDQIKKTFSDASRQVPAKNEDVIIKNEEAFIAEETNQLSTN